MLMGWVGSRVVRGICVAFPDVVSKHIGDANSEFRSSIRQCTFTWYRLLRLPFLLSVQRL
eukprot:738690-Pyramimonas_sp.AAC.1